MVTDQGGLFSKSMDGNVLTKESIHLFKSILERTKG